MHNLIMQTLQNQHEEMSELKRVLATLAGQKMVAAEQAELPDLKALHPRGEERFDETDLSQRWEANLHHNTLVSTIRKGLAAPVDKE